MGRDFIIEPRDVNGDDKLEWFELGDKPRLNTLMVATGEVTKWKATADAQKANSAGAKLGTTSSGKRRAAVMIPR